MYIVWQTIWAFNAYFNSWFVQVHLLLIRFVNSLLNCYVLGHPQLYFTPVFYFSWVLSFLSSWVLLQFFRSFLFFPHFVGKARFSHFMPSSVAIFGCYLLYTVYYIQCLSTYVCIAQALDEVGIPNELAYPLVTLIAHNQNLVKEYVLKLRHT